MDKNDINNIVKSELVARTNNAKIRQEYGQYRVHPNVVEIDGHIQFTTTYRILDIVYVTEMGVMQTLGVDYEILDDRTIRFLQEAGTRTTDPFIQIGYQFDKSAELTGLRPSIALFTSYPSSGLSGDVTFNFSILQNGATNIFWSIIRDGDANKVVATGTEISSSLINPIVDIITDNDVANRQGDLVPYTFIVVYDMAVPADPLLNEKLMATTTYLIDTVVPIVGSLSVSPSVVTTAGSGTYEVTFNIIKPAGSISAFNWKVVKTAGSIITVEDSGNESSDVVVFAAPKKISPPYNYTAVTPQSSVETYSLQIDENRAGIYREVASGTFKIKVVPVMQSGLIGYMPRSIYDEGVAGLPDEDVYLSKREDAMFQGGGNDISQDDLNSGTKLPVVANVNAYGQQTYYIIIELPIAMTGNSAGDVYVRSGIYPYENGLLSYEIGDGNIAYIVTNPEFYYSADPNVNVLKK
ncbi:MAG: hypothetical protein KAH32_03810 [Chlamydiia bacterium]|nr:hypothetical protein [Chlamydiia bacterium]